MVRLQTVRTTASDLLARIVASAREDPLVAALAVLLAAAALVVLALLVRRLRRPVGRRLELALGKPDSVAVLMHPDPDPDAMAAAIGVARLAERVGTPATLRYPGEIRHQENRAFRTVLNLDCESLAAAEEIEAEAVVLVDHNEPRGFAGAERLDPYAVVDHHPGTGSGTEFTDVRPEYGACASLVAEYFADLGVQPDRPDTDGIDPTDPNGDDDPGDRYLPSWVATGLLYGILADTNHLTRGCSDAEFEASAYLYPGVDEDTIDRIANPEIDAEVLDVKARAITDRDVRGPFAVSDVGELSNTDAIPQAADELLHLEGTTAVVVLGEKDGVIHISGRSRDDRVHMGDVLHAVVDDIPEADAGGHARMGGGRIPATSIREMVFAGDAEAEAGVAAPTRDDLVDRLFEGMKGER